MKTILASGSKLQAPGTTRHPPQAPFACIDNEFPRKVNAGCRKRGLITVIIESWFMIRLPYWVALSPRNSLKSPIRNYGHSAKKKRRLLRNRLGPQPLELATFGRIRHRRTANAAWRPTSMQARRGHAPASVTTSAINGCKTRQPRLRKLHPAMCKIDPRCQIQASM
jgi:hypothetical protein